MSKLGAMASKMIPQMIEASKPKLATFAKYARVEMLPPSPTEIPAIVRGFSKIVKTATLSHWRHLTVREAWLNTLITAEVMGWFFVGECIGKRGVMGYNV